MFIGGTATLRLKPEAGIHAGRLVGEGAVPDQPTSSHPAQLALIPDTQALDTWQSIWQCLADAKGGRFQPPRAGLPRSKAGD